MSNKNRMFIPVNQVPNMEQLMGVETGEHVTEQTKTSAGVPAMEGSGAPCDRPQSDFVWGFFFFDMPEIFSDGNKIYFNGEVSKDSMNALKREVLSTGKRIMTQYNELGIYKTDQMPLKLYINSPGGAMSAGWDFIDFMNDYQLPIHTIGTGTVASMGVNLLLAGTKKYITANTHLLVHQFSANVGGKIQEILDYMKHFDHIQEQTVAFISKNTKLDEKQVTEMLKSESWMSAKEALEKGFCDALI